MAWGYWTTYSTSPHTDIKLLARYRERTLSPPPSSLKRDSRAEKERLLKSTSNASNVDQQNHHGGRSSGAPEGSVESSYGSSAPGMAPLGAPPSRRQSAGVAVNHLPPDKVAYERHLLLGDPDWSSRTVADRNTLPRKKQFDPYDRGGSITPPEDVYSTAGAPGGPTQVLTPAESAASRKSSDDVFCPACAHQSSSQPNSSNRESRVSFGSIASSSRGSSGLERHQPSAENGGGGQRRSTVGRVRSRSQEDDESSAGGGILSSSVPTPPPPPFLSHRDIVHSSIMETINQKMSILSSIRNSLPNPSYPPPPPLTAASFRQSTSYQQPPQLPPKPNSNVTTTARRHSAGKQHANHALQHQQSQSSSSTSHHQHHQPPQRSQSSKSNREGYRRQNSSTISLKEQQQQQQQQIPARSSRSSSRTTPRGSSSHASHESVKSTGSGRGAEEVAPPEQDSTMGRESKNETDSQCGGSIIGIRDRSQTPEDDDGDVDESACEQTSVEATGTVRRRRRRSSHSRSAASQERLDKIQQQRNNCRQEQYHQAQIHHHPPPPPHADNSKSGFPDFSQHPQHQRYHHHHHHHHQTYGNRPFSRSQEHLDQDGRLYHYASSGGSRYSSRERLEKEKSHIGLVKSQEELAEHMHRKMHHPQHHHQHHHHHQLPPHHPPPHQFRHPLPPPPILRDYHHPHPHQLPPPPPLPSSGAAKEPPSMGTIRRAPGRTIDFALPPSRILPPPPPNATTDGEEEDDSCSDGRHSYDQRPLSPPNYNFDGEFQDEAESGAESAMSGEVRPRSSSIGEARPKKDGGDVVISGKSNTTDDRRHHTLDTRRGILASESSSDRRLLSLSSFQAPPVPVPSSAASSRSGKSSTRSSNSPSVENIKGSTVFLICTYEKYSLVVISGGGGGGGYGAPKDRTKSVLR